MKEKNNNMWSKYIYNLFNKDNINEKLLKNIERYEQKKREEQNKIRSFERNKSNRQKNETL
tara:strand:+ start:173 stop:355 length:183 start_codon:yes stop_codon:yes gene_type:complete